MEAVDTLRAQNGTKQLGILNTDIEIKFNTFTVDEDTVLNAIYVGDTDVLADITDLPASTLMMGVPHRAPEGKTFTKVNIGAGRILTYLEP